MNNADQGFAKIFILKCKSSFDLAFRFDIFIKDVSFQEKYPLPALAGRVYFCPAMNELKGVIIWHASMRFLN